MDLETKFAKRDFLVIYLDVPDEEAIRRISGRRICPKCGLIVNIHTEDVEDKCHKC